MYQASKNTVHHVVSKVSNPNLLQKNKFGRLIQFNYWVIPYQFTKLLHMTPSELIEIWCVGSSSGLIYPKGISPKLLVWLPRNSLLNIFSFCSFAMHIFIQSIITWEFFIVLKNGLHHFKAKRISFHSVYMRA